jgi:hypothetical protein
MPMAPVRTLSRPARAGQGRAILAVDGRGSSGARPDKASSSAPAVVQGQLASVRYFRAVSWQAEVEPSLRRHRRRGDRVVSSERRQSRPCVATVDTSGPTRSFPAIGRRRRLSRLRVTGRCRCANNTVMCVCVRVCSCSCTEVHIV